MEGRAGGCGSGRVRIASVVVTGTRMSQEEESDGNEPGVCLMHNYHGAKRAEP